MRRKSDEYTTIPVDVRDLQECTCGVGRAHLRVDCSTIGAKDRGDSFAVPTAYAVSDYLTTSTTRVRS